MIREYIIKIDDDDEKKDFSGGMPLVEKPKDLVRCKDCKHYRYYGLSAETVSECTIAHYENKDANWFCADGERNEGEQE